MKSKTVVITRTAVIAALYVAMTLSTIPLSFGPVQFRISEALTILPLFYVEAIPGLFIGCFLANIASTAGAMDMFVGSAATLVAALLTYRCRKIYLGVIPPVVINALVVPIILLTIPDIETGYLFNVMTVGIGQILAVCGLGIPFYYGLKSAMKKNAVLRPTLIRREKE